jgi:hypothetical protein
LIIKISGNGIIVRRNKKGKFTALKSCVPKNAIIRPPATIKNDKAGRRISEQFRER